MRYCSCQQGFASSWRTIKQHSLGLCDTQSLEDLRMLDGQLDYFLNFLDLLVKATDHVVRGVWHLFYLHQADKRVDFAWEDLVQQHRSIFKGNSDIGLQLLSVDFAVDVDNVLLRASYLDEALFLAHHFADFADLGVRLQQEIQLILEVFDHRVHLVALGFKSAQVVLLLEDLELKLLDL